MPLPSLPSLPTWSQTKTGAKAGFDKVYHVVDKLGPPVNKLSNKLGAEAFWPTTLDKESEKAARILRSFCKDGFYVEEDEGEGQGESGVGRTSKDGVPRGKQRVLKKIPMSVIKQARAIAIFTTMRTGLWFSGAGGAGILVARMADGRWSPPSGLMLHTAGLGALVGADIYDCVAIINTDQALEAFMKIRCTLGGEVSAVAGPVGIGGVLETEIHKRQAPVWNYIKSRGFYAGVQIDGTVIIQRTDENERFYGERMDVADILAGKLRHPPKEINVLINTLKAAQGDTDVDENALPSSEPIPSDYELADAPQFGMPDSTDPDPFGVKALEEQGMEIREAGTRSRPSIDAFSFRPSPTSPIYNTFHSRKNSKRDSIPASIASTARTDMATQTDDLPSPRFMDSPRIESPTSTRHDSPVKKTSENLADEADESSDSQEEEAIEPVKAQRISQISQAGAATTVISKPKLVTIRKGPPPPALPPRSPYRSSREGVPLASPSLLPPRSSGDLTHGLGIDVGAQSEDVGTQSLYQIPTQDTIPSIERAIVEEKLEQIHTAPSRDSGRLSPTKMHFDDGMSVSGSEYSRGETPALSRAVSHDDGGLYGGGYEAGSHAQGDDVFVDTPIVKQETHDSAIEHPAKIELQDQEKLKEMAPEAVESTPVMPGGVDWDADNVTSTQTPAPATTEGLTAHLPPSVSSAMPAHADVKAVHVDIDVKTELHNSDTAEPATLQDISSILHSHEDTRGTPTISLTTPHIPTAVEDTFHSVPQTPIGDVHNQTADSALPSDALKASAPVIPPVAPEEVKKEVEAEEKSVAAKMEGKENQKTEEIVKNEAEPPKRMSDFERKRAMFS